MNRKRQRSERMASLTSTAPLATSHARASRLPLKATKQRLTSRPLHQLAPPTPPFRRTRLLLPRLPIYLLFLPAYQSRQTLLTSHNSTRGVYFKLLLNVGQGPFDM